MIVVNPPDRKPLTCKLLIFMHVLLGIGAVFGGLVLVLDPSGGLIKRPITLLENSPFNNFLIPGIILFTMLGVFPLIISFALITKWEWLAPYTLNIFAEKHWSWTYSLYIGFALIIWVTVQVFMIDHVSIIHVVYILIGLSIQVVTLLPSVQNHYLRVR